MHEVGLKVLSSYERGLISGLKKSKGDKIVEEMMTTAVVNRMLQAKVTETLADGTTVTATAEELVVAAAIGDAIHKGSMEKLKTLLTIKGELKESTEVTVSLVDKDLLARAIE